MKFKMYDATSFKDDDNEFNSLVDDPIMKDLETFESQELKGKLVECKYCDGTGKSHNTKNIGMLEIGSKKVPCPACRGSGYQRV